MPRHSDACRSLRWPLSMTRSWNDLSTTAGTPEFLNSKAGEILSTSPNALQVLWVVLCSFFTYLGHAVGYRPHTALTCLPEIFMHPHPHRMDDRGSVKHLWETMGV